MSDEMDTAVLRESFAEFLNAEWAGDKAVAFARANATYAVNLWTEVAALGWPALTAGEEHGGLRLGTNAAAALHQALGAAAAPLPMLGTALAIALIEAIGTQAQKEALLPGLADGSQRACIAQPDAAVLTTDGSIIEGIVADVLDAPSATIMFLRANLAGKKVWLGLPAETAGITVEQTMLADTTRSLGTITLTNVTIDARHVLAADDAPTLDDELLRLASIFLAADALGGGEAVLKATIEYMMVREQFGQVIGSFQALKHRVADHKAALVASAGLVEHAANLATDDSEALLAALTAKQHVTRVAAEIARDCLQLHGGVGFTADYIPHIYLKRSKLSEALFGTRTVLLDRIADILEAA